MAACPHCGKQLKVAISKGKEVKQREKKDPNEAMSIDQFIESCRASKQAHVQIIGEFADTKRSLRKWEGFSKRGQWFELFFDRNLVPAKKLATLWTDEEGKRKIGKAVKQCSRDCNGTYEFTLETVVKTLEKV